MAEFFDIYNKDLWREPSYRLMDKFSLKGKKAFITGGAGGIGRNVAAAWAEAGADIALVGTPGSQGRLEPLVQTLASRYPVQITALYCDVSDEVQVVKLKDDLLHQMGTIDLALINAGVCLPHDDLDVTPQTWRRTMDVDLTGTYLTSQVAYEIMREHRHGGSILMVSSISGHFAKFVAGGPAPNAAYGAAKAGMLQYARYLAAALAPYDIRVNTLSPSNVWSGIHEGVMTKGVHDALLELVPMKRFGTNDEVQGAALFLASAASSYITGADLLLDGGYSVY